MLSVASVGECMLELSGAGADWRMGHAGDTFNTLWAMRALLPEDSACDYVSGFGDDPFSAAQIAFMDAARIGTAASPRIPGARPGLYAITLTGAERSFTYWRADSAARKLADDPAALTKSLAGRDLVYISGITLAILPADRRKVLLGALQMARREGARVAFDPNWRPRLWASPDDARAAIDAVLPFVDIALPTFPDEQALYDDADPEETAERIAALGVAEIVVKDGAEPTLIATAPGALVEVPATHVAAPVDTTGAGDSFNGAYLAARLLDCEPQVAAEIAHRVAASVIQVRGALAPFETMRDAAAQRP